MAIYVDLDSVPRALQDLHEGVSDDITAIIREEVRKGMALAISLVHKRDMIGINKPGYVASFEYVETRRGASIVNTAPYADALEYGAPAYKTNLGVLVNIIEWAMGKLGVTRHAANNIAQSVVKRLETTGIQGSYILSDTLDEVTWQIRRRLRQYALDHRAGKTRALIRFKTRWGNASSRRSVSV